MGCCSSKCHEEGELEVFSWGEKEGGNEGREQEIGRNLCTPKIVTPSQRGKRVEQFLRSRRIASRSHQ
ncbi:hypothetical protein AMELA_G00038830 [Ameiurus melas]|uniref:Uncharacterized protein n=1 Tax=Ameiurus melas TaxID=219545 RepID=A0A7J6B995_AMEME|nr:hypothetical protein AMELA_G00038830 [Ameiurus melas]